MSKLSENGAEIGMRVTCNRCGYQIFLRQIGYNSIDAACVNRHSFYDVFEPMPEDWRIVHDLGGWVCGECHRGYARLLEKYKDEVARPNELG